MKKIFIIHGFEGSPNGGWRPWLMWELEKYNIYACALSMPSPENPVCSEWVAEISRHIEQNKNDELYLVGHSLGWPTILRYLETASATNISGVVLVSSPSEKNNNSKIDSFLKGEFDFEKIKSHCPVFQVIHGDNDPLVPLENARFLSEKLGCAVITVKNGWHLNGSAGWFTLPQCLESLMHIMKIT
jgi:uncharacterized protein